MRQNSAHTHRYVKRLTDCAVVSGIGILATLISAQLSPVRAQQTAHAVSASNPDVVGETSIPSDALARFGLWITGTTSAPVSNYGALPHDRTLLLVGLERQYPITRGKWGTISTSPSLLPAIFTTDNRRMQGVQCGGTTLKLCVVSARYSSFGVGLMPLSIRAQTPAERRLSLALGIDGGAAWFTEPIPGELGTRLNFTAQATLDVVIRVAPRSWALVGYRHVHLSNGGLGEVNVGIDANLVTLGLQWR